MAENKFVSNVGQGLEFGRYCRLCINSGKGYFGFKYCPDCQLSVCSNCHDGEYESDGILTMNWKALETEQVKEN